MGPIALFDKSFLQSLSPDEAVWFDHFFTPNICPLFFVETLADLEKAAPEGQTPEQVVGFIANKTPEMHGSVNVFHADPCVANLLQYSIPMTGRVLVPQGRRVAVHGGTGVILEEPPESAAFSRWQRGAFHEVERQFARTWRAALSSMDLKAVALGMRSIGIDPRSCKSLEAARAAAEEVIGSEHQLFRRMQLVLLLVGVHRKQAEEILARWRNAGCPAIPDYAPYAAHVATVEIFFQIALGAGLISHERTSNRVDIAYLHYIPFCHLFISSDRLHRNCAPLFLRKDQDFIWGHDLKAELRALNEHYLQLPEEVRERGLFSFANEPPAEIAPQISALWEKRGRRNSPLDLDQIPEEARRRLSEHLKALINAPNSPISKGPAMHEQPDQMALQRNIRKRRGSWYQIPKDLEHREV